MPPNHIPSSVPEDFFCAFVSPTIPVVIVVMEQSYRFNLPTAFGAASLNISDEDFSARNPNEFYLVSHPQSSSVSKSLSPIFLQGGDLAWVMISSGLVLLMVPGLGLFYSGISEKCSAISMMWLSMMTTALIGVQV